MWTGTSFGTWWNCTIHSWVDGWRPRGYYSHVSTAAYYQARITATRALIEAYEGALTAFATNKAIQEYTIDTGQNRQTVARFDLDKINTTIQGLENRLDIYEARLAGCRGPSVAPEY